MKRREFIQSSILAALMGNVLSSSSFAQQSSAVEGTQQAHVLGLDAYSRYLHWLREPAEIAQACRELTCNSLMVTVGSRGAHVSLDNVAEDLPRFVNTLRNEGIEVRQIRGGNQTDVDADVERLVATMSELGIETYWLGTDRYDFSQPIMPQLDAIKRKLERFVALNERYGTKIQYHTRSGAQSVGSVVWDLLYVMRDFDPRHVGIHWDTGHMSNHGAMWETLFRTAMPYIATISWKDRRPVQGNSAEDVQGVALPGAGREFPQLEDISQTSADMQGSPVSRFGQGMGWGYTDMPIGTGWVNFLRYGELLKEMGYTGLMDLQAEYDYPLGGANHGRTQLTLPRETVLAAIKRDVLTLRWALEQSGSGIVI